MFGLYQICRFRSRQETRYARNPSIHQTDPLFERRPLGGGGKSVDKALCNPIEERRCADRPLRGKIEGRGFY
jgi:hypothetical protein